MLQPRIGYRPRKLQSDARAMWTAAEHWAVDTTPLVVVGDRAAADTNSLLIRDLTFLNTDVMAVTDASTQRLLHNGCY